MKNVYLWLLAGVLLIAVLSLLITSQPSYFTQLRELIGFPDASIEDTHNHEAKTDHSTHEAATATGLSEQAFLEHMIPHHQEAVTSSKALLATGVTNDNIRTLAQNIITAQEKEISDMKAWYQAWYGVPYRDTGTYEPMMRDTSTLPPAERERAFLEDMIEHHTMALTTTQSVIPNITHDELRTLATAILETQSAEIVTMRILLKEL